MNTKTHEFYNGLLSSDDIGVVLLTETWANSALLDSELFPDRYVVFRADRRMGRGGGVLLGVKSEFQCCRVYIEDDADLSYHNVDLLCVNLTVSNHTTTSIIVYIPPLAPASIYEHLFHKIELLSLLDNQFIFAGDFNIPNLDCINDSYSIVLNNFINSLSAVQINHVKIVIIGL